MGEFSSYGLAEEIAAYLDKVWHAEGGNGNAPDLVGLAKDSHNNVRDCLMRLDARVSTTNHGRDVGLHAGATAIRESTRLDGHRELH